MTITFDPVVPLWVLAAVVALGAGLAWFQYLRSAVYGVGAGARRILFGLKVLIFVLLAFLLANPLWTRETSRERPPRLVVLFDTSESMNSVGSPEAPTAFAKLRDGFFKKVYPLWGDKFQIRFYTFSSQAATTDAEKLRKMTTVGGAATNIRGAVLEALSQQGTNRPAALMLLTDGNHNWGPDPTPDILKPEGDDNPVPLIAVSTPAFGELKKSLAIPQVTLPSPVFSKEDTPIRFQVVASGIEDSNAKTQMKIDFMSQPDVWEPMEKGEMEEPLKLLGPSTQGSFHTRFPESGRYRIEIEASAPGLGAASTVREIQVEPGRWKIAYFCGRVGWMSQSLVRRLTAVPRYSFEAAIGNGPDLWGFISTGEKSEDQEVKKDVLTFEEIADSANLYIFENLSGEQQGKIPAEIVKNRVGMGAAVLLIAGSEEPPSPDFAARLGLDAVSPISFQGWFSSPSQKALLLSKDAGTHNVTSHPTLLGLGGKMPSGQQSYGGIRPNPDSQVLFEFGDNTPALVVKTVGDTRAAFLGIADLWRWQFQPGDGADEIGRAGQLLIDRLVRWLLMGEEESAGRPRLLISQTQVPLGKTIEVGVQYDRVIDEPTATVRLVVTDPHDRLSPLALQQQPGGFFTTKFTPEEAGKFAFAVSDPEIVSATDKAEIQVEPFSIETAISGAGEGMLQDLAGKSGGIWTDVEDIAAVTRAGELDKIYQPTIIRRTITEPLMSAPWIYIILVVLFSLEWTLRRTRDLP